MKNVHQTVVLGVAGNEISKKITGTSEVSVGRSAIATGAGTALGAVAGGALVIAGAVSVPVFVPIALVTGAVSFIASLWD